MGISWKSNGISCSRQGKFCSPSPGTYFVVKFNLLSFIPILLYFKNLQELRTEFDKKGLLLTAAVGAAPQTINRAYDVPAINKALDFIHIMAYDYHGSWDAQIGHNAPLSLPIDSSTLQPELRLSVVRIADFMSCL